MLGVKMLVELIEIKEDSKGNYFLNNIYVNPAQIVFLTENRTMKQKLQEGKMNLGLKPELHKLHERKNELSYLCFRDNSCR